MKNGNSITMFGDRLVRKCYLGRLWRTRSTYQPSSRHGNSYRDSPDNVKPFSDTKCFLGIDLRFGWYNARTYRISCRSMQRMPVNCRASYQWQILSRANEIFVTNAFALLKWFIDICMIMSRYIHDETINFMNIFIVCIMISSTRDVPSKVSFLANIFHSFPYKKWVQLY